MLRKDQMSRRTKSGSTAAHLSTRRRTYVVAAVALALPLGAEMPTASAATESARTSVAAVCSATIPLNISPGLLALTRTQGSNQSLGETGSLSCLGTLDGHPVAGPGTVGFTGTYDGTCNSTSGTGTWSFSLPVDDNGVTRVVHHGGAYTAPGLSLVIIFTGDFETGRLAGTGPVLPVQGNCLTQPMTKASFILTGLQLTQ
jgi:hypothetical protein